MSSFIASKYWVVYPYTYRLFVYECYTQGWHGYDSISEDDRYRRFLQIKKKYYRDAKDCIDEFTGTIFVWKYNNKYGDVN